MIDTKTHVYFVPGLAAGKEIFENISLPIEKYEVHVIEWIIPQKKETITQYAKKMSAKVLVPNAVLIGVSFGGIMVQEMSLFLELKKLIIISSVKSKYELPKRMRIFKNIRAYKLIPSSFLNNPKDFTKYAFGVNSKKKLDLYQRYLSVTNPQYLKWAIKQMVGWERKVEIEGVIHIHGDKDPVFPIKKIKKCIVVPNGSHIMLLTKFRWLNKNLPKIIEDSFN